MSNGAPPEFEYFLDRMLSGSRIADTLRARGLPCQTIEDHHDQRTADDQWLNTVGRRGWIALTKDEDIRRSPLTLEAVSRARARMFCLTANKLRAEAICELVTTAHPVMQEIARVYEGPFIANIGRFGDVRFIRGGTPYLVFKRCTLQQTQQHQHF